jgi:tRNA:m4X modification enzyme
MKSISELRVPCPYDPKHTCFATRMERHLKICNSKPPLIVPEYVVPGINSGGARWANYLLVDFTTT